MGKMGERVVQIENGEACPNCLRAYPAPTAGVESVTCGWCNYIHQIFEDTRPDEPRIVCPDCEGSGEGRTSGRCLTCHGRGEVKEMRDDDD